MRLSSSCLPIMSSSLPSFARVVRFTVYRSRMFFLPFPGNSCVFTESGSVFIFVSSAFFTSPMFTVLSPEKSVPFMRELCEGVALVPDMAMLLREDCDSSERSGCSLILRKDKERTLTDEGYIAVVNGVNGLFGKNYKECDTVLDYGVSFENRKKELDKLFDIYRASELVITDRLHGMIFGAVTGTPTIVLNSKSHKVIGCYEWLKHLDYIRLCESPELISETYSNMPHGSQYYDNTLIMEAFAKLRQDLLSLKQ